MTKRSWPAVPSGLPGLVGAVGLAVLVVLLVNWNTLATALLMLVATVLAVTISLRDQMPRLALGFLGICLAGYALLGKAFAYLGVAPLFVGEMALGLGVLAILMRGRVAVLARSPLLYLLLVQMVIGAAATLPYVGTYGIDALRDAVLWGYGLFSIIVAMLLLQNGWVITAFRSFARFVPYYLCAAPVVVILGETLGRHNLRLPGNSNIKIFDLKGGDVAVMLAMIAALLILGLHRDLGLNRGRFLKLGQRREWLWWMLWLATAAIPLFRVRAGLLAIAISLTIVFLGRPASRWWKPAIAVTLTFFVLFAFNVQFRVGEQRNTVSIQTLLLNVQSITESNTGDAGRDGTRGWRLHWWTDIVNYTLNGPYFWTGKGYGINLADADGYQLGARDVQGNALRSPHNGHMNVLARSGVPGFTVWVLVQATFAVLLLLAFLRARASGRQDWARLNLWTLAGWAAFMVNASFDVYLEGPQGGIWFWAYFGFGMALIEFQRRGLHTMPLSELAAQPLQRFVQPAQPRPAPALTPMLASGTPLSPGPALPFPTPPQATPGQDDDAPELLR
ncbi:O-antigen ligase family protein [Deinococcus sonorensis]|uniref:O-antigen ligase family protein n=2 Tax=Deinococcus sonorensis TaxID=309891 RepID=A0AAU7UE49_9DEIO